MTERKRERKRARERKGEKGGRQSYLEIPVHRTNLLPNLFIIENVLLN